MIVSNISGITLEKPIYSSPKDISITSLCEILPQKTQVYFCPESGHLQTAVLGNIDEYYDKDYKILIDSDDEDQLYKIVNGQKIFRYDYQADTLLNKVKIIPSGAKILDYGCAKATTLKRIVQRRPDIVPYLFDVSEMYIPFWEKFAQPNHWATHSIKIEWQNFFDIVTSFYALEHVAEPKTFMESIRSVLKPDGLVYLIVPNVYQNIADLVVADHINHFSGLSLHYLLSRTGFEVLEIDSTTHDGAFIVIARKAEKVAPCLIPQEEIFSLQQQAQEMANYWSNISNKIQNFERKHLGKQAAIYGSGFYGTFITTCLTNKDMVECFIDQNPYKQGKYLFDKPIVSSEEIPQTVEVVYLGLNPNKAQEEIAKVKGWNTTKYNYCFL